MFSMRVHKLHTIAQTSHNLHYMCESLSPTGETSERDLEYGKTVLDHLGLSDNLIIAKSNTTRDEFRMGMAEVGYTDEEDEDFRTLSQNVFKLTPLKQICEEHNVVCLLSGVRRGQTAHRNSLKYINYDQAGPAKAYPILDWSDEQCLEHLRSKNIPKHPEMDGLLEKIAVQQTTTLTKKTKENKQVAITSSAIIPSFNAAVSFNVPDNDNAPKADVVPSKTTLFRSARASQRNFRECGLHISSTASPNGSGDPVPPLPNMVVGKVKCRFCIAAKKLLKEQDDGDYIDAPVSLFPHLIPAGTTTVPVIYLEGKLIGGYSDLCAHYGVEDELNA